MKLARTPGSGRSLFVRAGRGRRGSGRRYLAGSAVAAGGLLLLALPVIVLRRRGASSDVSEVESIPTESAASGSV